MTSALHQSPRTAARTPIARWQAALGARVGDAADQLRQAYRETWPTQGEIIFTGACAFQCVHCIYPPTFAKHNRSLPADAWSAILADVAHGLGISTFVYGGRSVTKAGIDLLSHLRHSLPAAKIGLIDNGVSMLPLRNRLRALNADWIDVSLDGEAQDHDRQRGVAGSYQQGVDGARWLAEQGAAPRINILTCLTTINANSVIRMISDLNRQGFKNFLITPITTMPGKGPSTDLQLDGRALCAFIAELRAVLHEFQDGWIELSLFSACYAAAIVEHAPELWAAFQGERDSLVWHEQSAQDAASQSTDLFIRYYPSSLTGTRELIINTNADVILPKAMVNEQISPEHVMGNLLRQNAKEIITGFPETTCFDFYIEEFREEQAILRRLQ